MNWQRGAFALLALIAFFAIPAHAMTHEEHCGGEMAMEELPAVHHHEAAAAEERHASAAPEEVPMTAPKAACPHHTGQACTCKSRLMIGCNMKGCCIKGDGPLSTGLKDRTFNENDTALCDSPAIPHTERRLVNTAPGSPISPRDLPGPDPRPPSL